MPSLSHIAQLVNGKLEGPPDIEVTGVAPLDNAQPGQLVFAFSAADVAQLAATEAAAAVIPKDAEMEGVPPGLALLRVVSPRRAMVDILAMFAPAHEVPVGVNPTAAVAADAELAEGVCVGPFTIIERGARVGRSTVIYGQVYVGPDVEIGEECIIYPQAALMHGTRLGNRCIVHSGARIGADGFGYVYEDGVHHKVPQLGSVVIGDDVEVGANATIDRATLPGTATTIGAGTKIDDQVHIAHNCRIGRACVLCGQVGLSGSVELGDGVVLAGQVGVGDHIHIGAGAQLGAQAGVISDVPAGAIYSGYPARPHRQQMRAYAELLRLSELRRRISQLEARLKGQANNHEMAEEDSS